jgi:aromatic amino acid transport protein AroP
LATALCVLINYVMPGKAFELLMALVVAALVINWAMICITHLKFRLAMQSRKNHRFSKPRLSAD